MKTSLQNVESLLLLLGMADGSKAEKTCERKSTSEASPPSPDSGSLKRERTISMFDLKCCVQLDTFCNLEWK